MKIRLFELFLCHPSHKIYFYYFLIYLLFLLLFIKYFYTCKCFLWRNKPTYLPNLPLRLPILKINDYDIKRSSSIKFLGVLVDEHLSWTDHINILENKLSKNLGLLYKSKHFLNANGMKSLYYSFFHSYLNYGNIAWCSSSVTKIKKLYSKQKQAIKALSVTSEDYSGLKIEDLMEKTGILNIYKLNIYHVINLMFRVKNNTIPEAFVNKFEIVLHHHYQTRHSENNFIEPKIYFKATKFAISSRGPRLWNSLTDKDIITSTPLFKRRLKNHLIKIKNITKLFLRILFDIVL